MVNLLNYNIIVSEFGLLSNYYVNFLTDTLGKGRHFIKTPVLGQIVLLLFF